MTDQPIEAIYTVPKSHPPHDLDIRDHLGQPMTPPDRFGFDGGYLVVGSKRYLLHYCEDIDDPRYTGLPASATIEDRLDAYLAARSLTYADMSDCISKVREEADELAEACGKYFEANEIAPIMHEVADVILATAVVAHEFGFTVEDAIAAKTAFDRRRHEVAAEVLDVAEVIRQAIRQAIHNSHDKTYRFPEDVEEHVASVTRLIQEECPAPNDTGPNAGRLSGWNLEWNHALGRYVTKDIAGHIDNLRHAYELKVADLAAETQRNETAARQIAELEARLDSMSEHAAAETRRAQSHVLDVAAAMTARVATEPRPRMILVNVEALEALLQRVDPGGFQSGDLGVAWVSDDSGLTRSLIMSTETTSGRHDHLVAALQESLDLGGDAEDLAKTSMLWLLGDGGETVDL